VNAEIKLDAKHVSYDAEANIITASGDVLITQTLENNEIRELHSEKIEYNKQTGEIRLIGESIIKEPSGDLITAKSVSLDPEFKNAIAKALVIILRDASKIRAQAAHKSNEVFTFENATYSPCKEVNCSLPLWDLQAEKAIFDRKQKKFIYRNVKLRIKGVPVFFTPYFSHPSSEVKRKTGFLAPILRHNTDTGFYAGFPFYFAIDNHRDFKLTPFINTKNRSLVSGEYRQKFFYGDLDTSASVLTESRRKKALEVDKHTRWHVNSSFNSCNLENKRLVAHLNRSSDVTYKSVYPVDLMKHSDSWLREKYNDSKIVFDLYKRNYFLTAESHLYQTENKETVPFVLPHINFNYTNDFANGTIAFDSDSLYLTRKKEKSKMFAKDFFRSTNKISWEKQINLNPVLLEVNTGFRTDFYNVSETKEADRSKNKFFPILENQIIASVPLISEIKSFHHTHIWGPKITLTSIETSKERANFEQNEDSIFDSFSDLNLHTINRFGGYDSIELGERVSAGFESSIYNEKRRYLNVFIGKSKNIGNRQKIRFGGKNATVGRIVLKPLDNISFRMRFVGIPFIEKSQLFESGINASYKNIFGGIGYLYDTKISNVQENGISQFGINCGFRLTQYWSISGSKILNMKKKNGRKHLAQGIKATYADECLEFGIGVYKTNFKDNDIKPKTGIILSIVFKNLGNLLKGKSGYEYNTELGNIE
jgi:LPS-assembly protein